MRIRPRFLSALDRRTKMPLTTRRDLLKGAAALAATSRLESAEAGLALARGAKGELMGTTVSGCKVGISAEGSSELLLLHSRIEGASRN